MPTFNRVTSRFQRFWGWPDSLRVAFSSALRPTRQLRRPSRHRGGDPLRAPVKNVWEFGLKISATGDAKGISASLPVPMNWPEQVVEVVDENKSANVGRVKYDNPTKGSRQILINVNRLAAGEFAEIVARFQITKQMIIAPHDPELLKLASPVPSKLRTYLKPSPYIECTHRRIRDIAADLKDDSLSGWAQVEVIYNWVRQNVEYEFDTQIHSCLEALDEKKG